MEFVESEQDQHFDGGNTTLIMPAMSIGNVGQLAVDLLICSMGAHRIGYLDDPFVVPCVGNNPFGPLPQGLLALPIEAYNSSSNKLTLIQQRSPVVKGMTMNFAKNLADLAAKNGKKHIVVLSSLDSGRRQMIDNSSNTQIYYLSSSKADGTNDGCEKLGWERLEYYPEQRRWSYLNAFAKGDSLQTESSSFEDELLDEDYFPSLPFAALFSCCKAKGLEVTCILCYCSEGDNISDSFQLADATLKLLGKSPDKLSGQEEGGWRMPYSWSTVYGPPADMTLF